jgi:opacity protein-like surface antigen
MKRTTYAGRIIILALSLILIAGAAQAQRYGRNPRDSRSFGDFSRFSLSAGGGIGLLEHGHSMVDLKAELQYGLARNIKIGLGIGYINNGGGRDGRMDGNRRGSGMDMMSDRLDLPLLQGFNRMSDQGFEFGRALRALPLSLNVYYVLPLGRKWNVFLSGGGSYYFGSFRGPQENIHKNTLGGQAGLGFEFRLTERIQLTAEGGYRFAEFKGLKQAQQNRPMPFLRDLPPAWSIVQTLFAPPTPKPVDVNFNGFSFRAGLKFGI